jgi:thiamine-monophosphate kinase
VSVEDELIARYFKPLARHPGTFGFTDDASAITPPAGHDLVLKTDGLIEGVHYFADDPAADVARKALRVNLSDLASKGAMPLGFLLAIALSKGFAEDWLAAFARGLGEDADAYQCPLLGGDTDSTPGPTSISIAAFGVLPQGTMVRRAGAMAGDRVFVTGTIGDAALGLAVRQGAAGAWKLDGAMTDHLVSRYRLPQPRTALSAALREHASAAMDVSDGLAADLAKLCGASKVSADIEVAHVPLSPAARRALAADPALIEPILTGGEDYEILCAVPAARAADFTDAAAAAGIAVTDIGRCICGEAPPRFFDTQRHVLTFARPGYSHF